MPQGDSSDQRASFYGTLASGWEWYRRPGARLTEKVNETAKKHMDRGLDPVAHKAFHQFDKSHQLMLAEQDIVPIEKAIANLKGLREMECEGEIKIREDSSRYCHAGEAYLLQSLGEETAGWLHTGRSTGDLLSVARRFMARESLLELMDACLALMDTYCEVAEKFRDAIMPNYTLSQQAQVGTFGWYLIGWERPIERSYLRFSDMYDRVNQSPAGLGAGTTTDFPIDRERTAELLGFDGLVDNAEDGLHSDFDLWLEALSAATTLTTSISFAADHIFLWNTREFDMVDLPDRFFGTSSIMPQKRNAYAVQEVQQDAGPTIGRLMEAYTESRNINGSPGVPVDVFSSVIEQTETWRDILQNLKFDRTLAEERVYLDWALAADLASMMVREADIPWRWAHQITAVLVRKSEEVNRDVREVTTEHVDDAARKYLGESLKLNQSIVDEIIDAERAVEARSDTPGSPAPNQVDEQIKRSRTRFRNWSGDLKARQNALEDSEERLDHAVNSIIDSGS